MEISAQATPEGAAKLITLRSTKRLVKPSDIIRMSSDGGYTRIFLVGEKHPIMVCFSLAQSMRDYPFMVRVTRSLAVNPDHVVRTRHWNIIEVGDMEVKLTGQYANVLKTDALPIVNKRPANRRW